MSREALDSKIDKPVLYNFKKCARAPRWRPRSQMFAMLMEEAETSAVKILNRNGKADVSKASTRCISTLTDSRRARSQKAKISRTKHNEYMKILEREVVTKEREIEKLKFERNLYHDSEVQKKIQFFESTTDAKQQRGSFQKLTNLSYPVPAAPALPKFDQTTIIEQEYRKPLFLSDREVCNGRNANLISVSDFDWNNDPDFFILENESADLSTMFERE